jgi:hypothetical protein
MLAAQMGVQFPIVQMATLTNNQGPFSLGVTSLGPGSTGMLNAVFQINNMGLAIRLDLRGREVPEPTESGMVLLGTLGLGIAWRFRRRTT